MNSDEGEMYLTANHAKVFNTKKSEICKYLNGCLTENGINALYIFTIVFHQIIKYKY